MGFLSNPRRIHSKEKDEEKGEQGLPGAPICCNTLPLPRPLPPHTHRAPAGLPGAALSEHISPPIVHVIIYKSRLKT